MPRAPLRRRPSHAHRLAEAARHRAWALGGSLALAAALTQAADAQPPREPLALFVSGLLAYTTWAAPLPAVRLCLWGQGRGIDAIVRGAPLGNARQPVTIVRDAAAVDAPWRCDAVFVAAGAPPAAYDLPRTLAGRPVLVIGEGKAFCTIGGMFCVDADTSALRFHANLEAIARSGLRVHPQVLRIAHDGPGS